MSEPPDIYQAKLLLGFGDVDGFSKPCEVEACGSRMSRTCSGKTRCWDHYDGPLQLELEPRRRHLVRKGSGK